MYSEGDVEVARYGISMYYHRPPKNLHASYQHCFPPNSVPAQQKNPKHCAKDSPQAVISISQLLSIKSVCFIPSLPLNSSSYVLPNPPGTLCWRRLREDSSLFKPQSRYHWLHRYHRYRPFDRSHPFDRYRLVHRFPVAPHQSLRRRSA